MDRVRRQQHNRALTPRWPNNFAEGGRADGQKNTERSMLRVDAWLRRLRVVFDDERGAQVIVRGSWLAVMTCATSAIGSRCFRAGFGGYSPGRGAFAGSGEVDGG